MSASERFEKLYKLESAKYVIRTVLLLVLPATLVVYLLTQNLPSKYLSTETAIVTYVNSTSTNAETGGAGGQSISHVIVRLADGNKTNINVLYKPIPKTGDAVFIKKYKNKISGISYLYGGIKINEN